MTSTKTCQETTAKNLFGALNDCVVSIVMYPICYLHLIFFGCPGQPLAALAPPAVRPFLPAASGITGNPIFRDDRRSDKLQAIELRGHLKCRLTVVVVVVVVVVWHMWNENKHGSGDDSNPKIHWNLRMHDGWVKF